jgi:hypothetical protein
LLAVQAAEVDTQEGDNPVELAILLLHQALLIPMLYKVLRVGMQVAHPLEVLVVAAVQVLLGVLAVLLLAPEVMVVLDSCQL